MIYKPNDLDPQTAQYLAHPTWSNSNQNLQNKTEFWLLYQIQTPNPHRMVLHCWCNTISTRDNFFVHFRWQPNPIIFLVVWSGSGGMCSVFNFLWIRIIWLICYFLIIKNYATSFKMLHYHFVSYIGKQTNRIVLMD